MSQVRLLLGYGFSVPAEKSAEKPAPSVYGMNQFQFRFNGIAAAASCSNQLGDQMLELSRQLSSPITVKIAKGAAH